ncbi:TPA: hypothetical protein TXU81_000182 [Streptococcus suis]|uniref:hypothetical protein n=4 Tax=Streptococcus suis TaxID=1307 RepID=UPI000A6D3B43|nr:hypothetical protein [Streptococcus suis]NQN62681.1 hypothetical protein [Streptococcus suis]NQO51410.1 hypothetical protein [Streptococcus suis]NQR42985.1 hypothetical protein [Streptococcus suis]WNF78567.1 hypothetical protein RJW55_04270 [Streptococcus suis]HEL1587473.1 hypothetical protein [Streptococcus suis]
MAFESNHKPIFCRPKGVSNKITHPVFCAQNLTRSCPQTPSKIRARFQKPIFEVHIQIVKNTSEIGWTYLPKRVMMSGILIITDKDFMDDYETNQYLKKLGAEIREQTFWGLIPKLPKWDVTELGAYLPAISLPAFIQHLNVRNGVLSFNVISYKQFTKHTETYEINANSQEFLDKLNQLITSTAEEDFCYNLLEILKTEVYFINERDE